ncbi:uncharacterized protein LOC127751291 [Frankliniella occidentalis]|uniref:Uncharacterized protein LOC127751291 n=1 Tax=Frankliniella occidentalis TaxID=133901 RepID=A0A9C6X798_FRAOC|nr:uncharacterized protein LOC127751291 [Frankliniella occidentalis]
MEVSLASWLVGDLDDSKNGYTRWPPDTKPISQLVKNQAPCNEKWDKFKVQVMKYYDTFSKALAAVPKFVADSTYETEDPEIPVKRRRIRTQRFESSSEDDLPVKASVKSIKPPPAIKAKPNQQLSRAALKSKDKQAIIEKLKQAKATLAAKTKSPSKGSPWKVTAQDNEVSPQKCKEAASASSTRNSVRTPDVTPEKSQQAASSSRNHVRTPTPFLESPPASQHNSPGRSTQPSPVGSTQGGETHHEDLMDYGFETEEKDDNLDTPIMTPYKSPPKRSPSNRLTRSNAFCYSPETAAAYTADLHARVARKADGNGTSELRGVRNLFPSSQPKEGNKF